MLKDILNDISRILKLRHDVHQAMLNPKEGMVFRLHRGTVQIMDVDGETVQIAQSVSYLTFVKHVNWREYCSEKMAPHEEVVYPQNSPFQGPLGHVIGGQRTVYPLYEGIQRIDCPKLETDNVFARKVAIPLI